MLNVGVDVAMLIVGAILGWHLHAWIDDHYWDIKSLLDK